MLHTETDSWHSEPFAHKLLRFGRDLAVLSRIVSHVSIVAFVFLITYGVQLEWAQELSAQQESFDLETPGEWVPDSSGGPVQVRGVGFLTRAAVPRTTIPKRVRTEVLTYEVQPGDTLYDIAERFEISGETIMWANGRMDENPDLLSIGQQLIILPVSGVYHTVEEGDTLGMIAARYSVDPLAITEYEGNELEEPYALVPGMNLIVPGGKKPYVPRRVFAYHGPVPVEASKGTGQFGWPVSGSITQKFWAQHRAVDVGAPQGTPVYAADSGYVGVAGWSDVGYGRMVIIDHGNGFQTLYAHLQAYYVEEGESVGKGQQIGIVGSTGNSTGPHLHFEVVLDGVRRNPLIYLP